jgi:oligopeptide transport system substrate-binding protein
LGYDAEAARALLAKAGFPDGEGFPSFTMTIVDDETNRTTAEFLQEQLRINLGIDMQIETLDESAFYDRYQIGDFQVTWSSWFADYADPDNWLPQQFGTDGGFNVLGYSNAQVDELFALAATEHDRDARLALYDQAHKLILEDQAVTPVFHPDTNYLVKANVAGLATTALDAAPGDWFTTNVRILQFGDSAPPASDP